MNEAKLKACPFCGVEAKEDDGDYVLAHSTECFFTQYYVQEMWLVGKRKVRIWNNRAGCRKPENDPTTEAIAASPSATGSAVFGNIETITATEEKLVSAGICPPCIPPEGRPPQMRLLGDFGPMRAWQCGRCTNVWITSPPNAEVSASARDKSKP